MEIGGDVNTSIDHQSGSMVWKLVACGVEIGGMVWKLVAL